MDETTQPQTPPSQGQDFGGFLAGLGAPPPGTENRWKRFMTQPENVLTGLVLAGALASGANLPRAGAATLAFRGTLEDTKRKMAEEDQQRQFDQAQQQQRTDIAARQVATDEERNKLYRENMQLTGLQNAGQNALTILGQQQQSQFHTEDMLLRKAEIEAGVTSKALEFALKAPRMLSPAEYLNNFVTTYSQMMGEAPGPEEFQKAAAGYQGYQASYSLLTTNPNLAGGLKYDPSTGQMYVDMPGAAGSGAPPPAAAPGGGTPAPAAEPLPVFSPPKDRAATLLNKPRWDINDVKDAGSIINALSTDVMGGVPGENKQLVQTLRDRIRVMQPGLKQPVEPPRQLTRQEFSR